MKKISAENSANLFAGLCYTQLYELTGICSPCDFVNGIMGSTSLTVVINGTPYTVSGTPMTCF